MIFEGEYYIIGTRRAEQWLEENYGIFTAIGRIKEYEQDNFGKIYTDISDPESVVNSIVRLIVKDLFYECPTVNNNWNNKLTEEDIKAIIKELEELRPDND